MLPRVSLIEGQKAKFLLFSTGDLITQKLFREGSWEDHFLAISKVFNDAVDSPVVLDIGANLGAYSVPIAKDIQEKNGVVIAFEPQRIIYYQLCANIFLNRLENVFAYNKAVSDDIGEVEIPDFDYETNPNIGAFSLEQQFRIFEGLESSVKDSKFTVDVITLDSLELDRSPTLIKIDVERYELNVLEGSRKFLHRHNYPPIIFEAWNYNWFEERRRNLFAFIEGLGYTIFQFDQTNSIAQHTKNPVFVDFQIDNGNIYMNRIR